MRALLLIDHGSRREAANQLVERIAEELTPRVASGTLVLACHMELARPTIAEAVEKAIAGGARRITAIPFMLTPGRHTQEDIPRLVAEALVGHPGITHRVTAPLGVHPGIGELILDLATGAV
ncbi:MAG: hypothetical protein KC416_15010 [Myxococcales bacterium]|nr:hypothetical protein [Myxococcales bacterium]